jgi:uncharacterized protein YjbI with pentapeptide repeats
MLFTEHLNDNAGRYRGAELSEADLSRASLGGAYLTGAVLIGAGLNRASLSRAYGTTKAQLARAKSLEATIMPDGSTHD